MLGDVRRSSLSEKRCSSGAKGEGMKPSYILADSKMVRGGREGAAEAKERGERERGKGAHL